MVVVSTNGRQDTEESVVLGMDFTNTDWFVPPIYLYTIIFSCVFWAAL